MNKPTPYVKLAWAEFAECRIERLFVKPRLKETIRFSDWRGGHFNKRALDLPEDELLVLIGDAIAARVFSPEFLAELAGIVCAQERKQMQGHFDWQHDGEEIQDILFTTPQGALTFTPRYDQRPFPMTDAGKAIVKARLKEVVDLLVANIDKL